MSRGQLRVYLGAAPGVGKTYEMLEEGHRLLKTGRDVVVAYLETHGRAETAAVCAGLEVLPRRKVVHRDLSFEEMDVEAVLSRAPDVALVDELAHTNVPGSGRQKRHQDVAVLLEAGIDVITTLNIQHLDSVNDVVEGITGVRQQETVPDDVVRAADEIELVDLPPEQLRSRLAAGKVYAADKVDTALSNFFRPGNLGALREIALMWLADRVDEAVAAYRAEQGIVDAWETRERVLVALTGTAGGDHLVRRASRIAARGRGELIGVHVSAATGLTGEDAPLLEEHRELLEDLDGTFREVVAESVAAGLLATARAEGATQIVLGASRRSRWAELLRGSVITEVLHGAGSAIDVHVISAVDDRGDTTLPRTPRLGAVGARRRVIGLAIAVVGLLVITWALAPEAGFAGLGAAQAPPVGPDALTLPLLLYLALTATVAAIGGLWPGLTAAVLGVLAGNTVFTNPRGELTVASSTDVVALIVFLLISVLVSTLTDVAVRRAAQTSRARAEVRALSRLAATIRSVEDPLQHLTEEVRTLFGQDGVALVRRDGDGWVVDSTAGDAPTTPTEATDRLTVDDDRLLLLRGPRPVAEDRRLLAAVVAQVAVASTWRSLNQATIALREAQAGNELRSALLSAVSHDLRTPLASIKASATSLLARDVDLSPDLASEFAGAIVTDVDRMNRLVTNLLDMSRLQAGATEPLMQAVGLEDVVAQAVEGVSPRFIDIRVPAELPAVQADPALLERVVANLVENAVRVSAGALVVVWAGQVPEGVLLRVIDRGPGIAPGDLQLVFQPFQRLGDRPSGQGVGLGLAIAKGFTVAMGGRLHVEATPGGGTTMALTLRTTVPGAPTVPASVGPDGAGGALIDRNDMGDTRE